MFHQSTNLATPEKRRQNTAVDLLGHINHIRNVSGVEHVGIGSDFCGAPMPAGLEGSDTYPILIAALIEDESQEWTNEELGMLASGNLIRWALGSCF